MSRGMLNAAAATASNNDGNAGGCGGDWGAIHTNNVTRDNTLFKPHTENTHTCTSSSTPMHARLISATVSLANCFSVCVCVYCYLFFNVDLFSTHTTHAQRMCVYVFVVCVCVCVGPESMLRHRLCVFCVRVCVRWGVRNSSQQGRAGGANTEQPVSLQSDH